MKILSSKIIKALFMVFLAAQFFLPAELYCQSESLFSQGQSKKYYLGISFRELTPANRRDLGLGRISGVVVTQIVKGSAAEKGGLEVGDLITGVNGLAILGGMHFLQMIEESSGKVAFRVTRKGKVLTKTLELSAEDPFEALYNVIFEDEFNDAGMGWKENVTKNGRAAMRDGRYVMCNLTEKMSYYVWNNKFTFQGAKEFTIEVMIKRAGGPQDRAYGLVWSMKDVKNNCNFLITNNGGFKINAMENGKEVRLMDFSFTDAIRKDAVDNKLTVVGLGDVTVFLINDIIVASVPRMKEYGGMIGFKISPQVEIQADYMRVTFGMPQPLKRRLSKIK